MKEILALTRLLVVVMELQFDVRRVEGKGLPLVKSKAMQKET